MKMTIQWIQPRGDGSLAIQCNFWREPGELGYEDDLIIDPDGKPGQRVIIGKTYITSKSPTVEKTKAELAAFYGVMKTYINYDIVEQLKGFEISDKVK